MKTLINSTDTLATYEFVNGTATKQVTYRAPEPDESGTVPQTDFEAMATADHEAWLAWLNVE